MLDNAEDVIELAQRLQRADEAERQLVEMDDFHARWLLVIDDNMSTDTVTLFCKQWAAIKKNEGEPVKEEPAEKNLIVRPIYSVCTCVDVGMGSYDNQIMLGFYPVMREYRERRLEAGLTDYGICVDRCLSKEIIKLWENNVMTFGCCCGHGNDEVAMINVKAQDVGKLIILGYTILEIKPDMEVVALEIGEESK